jgi:hypothetical protein
VYVEDYTRFIDGDLSPHLGVTDCKKYIDGEVNISVHACMVCLDPVSSLHILSHIGGLLLMRRLLFFSGTNEENY